MPDIIDAPWPALSGYSLGPLSAAASNPARAAPWDQIVEFGEPRWLLQPSRATLSVADTGLMDAFFARLAAGALFRAGDPLRRRPLAYRTGTGTPWLAASNVPASVHAIVASAWAIEIAGLATGAIVSPGDMLSWVATGETEPRLYRVAGLQPVAAGGNGRAVVRVWPRPKAAAQGVAVLLADARGLFAPVADDLSRAMQIGAGPNPGSFQFSAISTAG